MEPQFNRLGTKTLGRSSLVSDQSQDPGTVDLKVHLCDERVHVEPQSAQRSSPGTKQRLATETLFMTRTQAGLLKMGNFWGDGFVGANTFAR